MSPAAHAHRRTAARVNGPRPQDSRGVLWDTLLQNHPEARRRRVLSNDVAHDIVREGITGKVLIALADLLELGPTQLAPVIGVERTTARRYVQNDQLLPKHSAETVLHLAELEFLALEVFASEDAAHGWLKKEHPLLGESPIDAASTSYGAQRVKEILVAARYGGVA